MAKILTSLGLCAMLACGSAARADPAAAAFDGTWSTVVSCALAPGAVPYSYEFTSTVANGVLHGERGVKGTPGWLQLDGHIQPDGAADIAAHGLVGKERAAVGNLPPGTPYHYRIDARFSEKTGEGHRVKGRTCTVTFSRRSA